MSGLLQFEFWSKNAKLNSSIRLRPLSNARYLKFRSGKSRGWNGNIHVRWHVVFQFTLTSQLYQAGLDKNSLLSI